MTVIQRQVRIARHRLWINRWLHLAGWWLLFGTLAWTLTWVINRLLSLGMPMGWIALAALGASLVGSLVVLIATREPDHVAAAALDEAAGLKERVSTGLMVEQRVADPFAQAVVADAHRVVAGLSARTFIPIRWPGTMSASALMLVVALLSLLLPEFDLLGRKEAQAQTQARNQELNRVRTAVARPVSAIQKIAETNTDPAIQKEIKGLEDALKKDVDPDVVRREAAKQLDRLEDVLKNKSDADRYKALNETKNRLKQMGQPEDPKGDMSRLIESLASGDFDQASKEIKKAQDKLSKMAGDPKTDPQKIEQMKKQLDDLTSKLEKAAEDKKSQRELQNAGLSENDIKRVMDAVSKMDAEQLEKLAKELAKRLADKGMTKEQMQKLINKIAQNQQACKQLQKMCEKMSGACKQLSKGDNEAAKDQLGQADQMLSEMEQMEQAVNELDAQMSQVQQARNDLDDSAREDEKCKQCSGTGFRKDGSPCPKCHGSGNCRGRGRGSGPRERDDQAEFGLQNKKDKTITQQGSIIGQQFVKGRQLKNSSEAELYDAAKAAELDATDSLNRERIPPAYRRSVRTYFDRLGEQFKPAGKDESKEAEKPADKASDTKK